MTDIGIDVGRAAEKGLARELAEHARAVPRNEPVVARMLELLAAAGEPFSRRQVLPGHFTASAFVLCPERRRVLLVHHQKLSRWLQPGGHVEAGDVDLESAARREVSEETGVAVGARLAPGIFDVDVHVIPQNAKEGSHQHFDVRYAFLALDDRLDASPEVLGARWVELGEVAGLTDEDSVLRCIERLRSSSG